MKLSQKLLALGGVTLADYACCPYDDYGMPHSLCTAALPEKTPFSLDSDWTNGACKAWESNVDATYDGNDQGCGTNENWGSCGFQRHFPWNEVDTTSFRNRDCVITYDANGLAYDALSAGCNCQGLGDAGATGAVVCKTRNVIAGTTTASSTCTTYEASMSTTFDLADAATENGGLGICCDPAEDHVHLDTDGTTQHTISCVQTCTALDAAELNGKPKCYESDFLGRRNIQAKTLYFTDANTYTSSMFAGVSTMEFSYNADPAAETGTNKNSQLYNLAGVPFLGGVCKLFVPVPKQRITSVQIAGVHVSLDRGVGYSSSVYAAKVGDAPDFNEGDEMGTAYCFSVVNPAEGMVNENNGIHNGNVAGSSVAGSSNPIFGQLAFATDATSLTRQAGIEPEINFFDGSDDSHIGTQLQDTAGFTASGDSKVGANFDVVVHIHSEWCNSQSFWTYADMQLTGDFNNGNDDYPLNLAPGDDQRTAAAYSQTGALQLDELRAAATAATTAAASAEAAYQAGSLADFTGSTCGVQLNLGANAACLADFNTYLAAYIAEQICLELINDVASFCPTENTATSDASTVVAGGECMDLLSDCTAALGGIAEVTTLLGHADTVAHINAAAANIAATDAKTAAEDFLTNGDFTHAHMDLMDKRHAMVAGWNNVYEAKDGYLRFPHNEDDFFRKANGDEGDEADYVAASNSEYLRWPNAGAFAAFYSFVSCANPPHIHETDLADEPSVNRYSVIYNSGQTLTAPNTGSETSQYAHYGKRNLRERTLVMSQSDSDYRDENCDQRTFRANLRQVGNDVTVCGPGQLPDTDNKRCSWNWNYYSSNVMTVAADANSNPWDPPSPQSPLDAEEWFDRNDPHSFDMWSTRKRRSESANSRKYAFNQGYWGVQQGKLAQAGAWNAADNWNADSSAHGAAIEIPIQDFNFNLNFKTANGGTPLTPVVTSPNPDNCEFTADACFCRPRFDTLTGFETNKGSGTDVAITFSAGYTIDASWPADGLAHSSCAGDENEDGNDVGDDDNLNGVNVCNPSEIALIKENLQEAACDGYKSDGSDGFKQTDNVQTLVFDDDRVVTSLNPNNNEWEVSVQCNPTRMADIGQTVAQRDLFPDCFFGDELWFTFTYSSEENRGLDARLAHNTYVSAWTSELKSTTQEYITTQQLSTDFL